MTMQEHIVWVSWEYIVPSRNETKIVISQRKDGPFFKDEIGEDGYYYVSIEDIIFGRWTHREGSSCGGLNSFLAAELKAQELWEKEAKTGKVQSSTNPKSPNGY